MNRRGPIPLKIDTGRHGLTEPLCLRVEFVEPTFPCPDLGQSVEVIGPEVSGGGRARGDGSGAVEELPAPPS